MSVGHPSRLICNAGSPAIWLRSSFSTAVSLASMGKMLFRAVLQVNEYLQSVSTEARTREISGRELKAGVKLP